MDKTTQSTSSAGMRPMRPSHDSHTSHQHEFSSQEQHNGSSDKQIKNRSCLPGYPNHRSSSSNSTNTRRVQQSRSNSMSVLNHRDDDTVLTDEIFMMDHLAIAPSASMPIHGALIANDNRDLYRYHHDRRNGNHLLPSRGNSTPQRRSRNTANSISRSATAALATPRSSSTSTSRARSSTHHKNHHNSSQQRTNSTASTGSRYNYPMGATTSASPSKRSSSRISFSSQLSSTTTAPSIHDIDDIGTVSSRPSENSSNHVHYNQHQKPPSPMTATNSTVIRQNKPNGNNSESNQSIGSTTTRSSAGTNTMGNTEAISKRRNQKSSLSPSHTVRTNNTMHKEETSSAIPSQKVILDVDTMKHHAQETRRIIDGKCDYESPFCRDSLIFKILTPHCCLFQLCIDHMGPQTTVVVLL
jgi:hypothetical protein